MIVRADGGVGKTTPVRDSGSHRRYSGGSGAARNGSPAYGSPVIVPNRVAAATDADGTGARRRLESHTRPWRRASAFLRAYRYVDIIVVMATLFGVFLLMNADQAGAKGLEPFLQQRITVKNVLLLALFGMAMQVSLGAFGMYDERRFAEPAGYVLRLIAACLVGMAPVIMFPLASRTGAFGAATVSYFVLAMVAALVTLRAFAWIVAKAPTLKVEERHVLIVGSGPRAQRLYHEIANHWDDGVRVQGFVDSAWDQRPPDEVASRMLGSLDQLEGILMGHVIDDVLITLPIKSCYDQIQETIALCERLGVRAAYLADISSLRWPAPRSSRPAASRSCACTWWPMMRDSSSSGRSTSCCRR